MFPSLFFVLKIFFFSFRVGEEGREVERGIFPRGKLRIISFVFSDVQKQKIWVPIELLDCWVQTEAEA